MWLNSIEELGRGTRWPAARESGNPSQMLKSTFWKAGSEERVARSGCPECRMWHLERLRINPLFTSSDETLKEPDAKRCWPARSRRRWSSRCSHCRGPKARDRGCPERRLMIPAICQPPINQVRELVHIGGEFPSAAQRKHVDERSDVDVRNMECRRPVAVAEIVGVTDLGGIGIAVIVECPWTRCRSCGTSAHARSAAPVSTCSER